MHLSRPLEMIKTIDKHTHTHTQRIIIIIIIKNVSVSSPSMKAGHRNLSVTRMDDKDVQDCYMWKHNTCRGCHKTGRKELHQQMP